MYEQNKGFFDSLPPKPSFYFGLISGIALFLILAMVFLLSGGKSLLDSKTSGSGAAVVAQAPSAPVPSPTPSPIPPPPPPPPAGDPPPITDDDHVRGDKNAKLAWIEYSDYECPFCKKFHPTMQQMMQEFDGKIKWVYRHFPLSFHRPLALKQAEAVECANELGGNDAFWKITDAIFERTTAGGNGMAVTELGPMAAKIGLDETKFQECLDSGKYVAHIEKDMSDGSAAGISGTPGSFLVDADGNSQLISGAVPYTQIKAQIEAAL